MGEPASADWVPTHPDTHPPFEAGNEVAVKHGAYSPRKVDPLAKDLVDSALADPALRYLQAPAYRAELWAWGRAEARVQLLTEWLEARAASDGVADPGEDRVRSASLELHRAESRAASARTRLGLTPLARARLGKDVAQGHAADADVALRMAQLAELERQGWTPPPAPPSDAEGGGPA